MAGNVASSAASVQFGAPALGSMAGLLLTDHHGLPIWFVLAVMSVSLFFGMWAAAGRPRDPAQRAELRRLSKHNSGALWILACVIVVKGEMALPGAMMTALVLGLLGTRALEAVEKQWLGKFSGGGD